MNSKIKATVTVDYDAYRRLVHIAEMVQEAIGEFSADEITDTEETIFAHRQSAFNQDDRSWTYDMIGGTSYILRVSAREVPQVTKSDGSIPLSLS